MAGSYAGPGDCFGTATVFIGIVDPGITCVSIITVRDATGLNKEDDGWCSEVSV
jgi:hypothetical protein